MPKRFSCIVIGAGLAGLSSAYRLTQAGWTVTVLEAQDRFGGRVMSHAFTDEAPHLVCELGAEWIGKSHTRIRRLCNDFKLPLQKHQYSFCFWYGAERSRFYTPGAWCFSKGRVRKKFNALRAQFDKLDLTRDELALREMDQTDWWTSLRRLGFSEDDLLRRDLAIKRTMWGGVEALRRE